jgi:ribose transport system ATP-binding protein
MPVTDKDATQPAIAVEGVTRTFGAIRAVDDVSFAVQPGAVHALLGENGAGKSTVVKLLSGLIAPDSGRIELFGAQVRLDTPQAAHAHGVQTAYQEMSLIPDLTVLDNLLLGYAPIGFAGVIRRRAAQDHARALFDELRLEAELWRLAGELDLAVRQKVEIARAIFRRPRILLLDEPTSTLTGRDVDWLGDVIAGMKSRGVTVLFISHRLREVRAFCSTLSVLRNGAHIFSGQVNEVSDDHLVEMIVGRSLAQTFPPRPNRSLAEAPEVLGARNLSAGEKLSDVSFSLRRGEILGVAGLQGMGQLDLFQACFGLTDIRGGQIRIDGRPAVLTSPADMIRPNVAIGFVPEDRKTEGLFLRLSGLHNATLPVIERFSANGIVDRATEASNASQVFARLGLHQRALWTMAGAFSGGNQQKIAVAKWFLAESRVLLLFDPTRGIDVGTKHELYLLMRAFADAGGSVLLHSTELPEVVNLCDRVIVLYGGRIALELSGDAINEPAVMRAALGSNQLEGQPA